jgi:hypothetical protein
MAKLHVAHGIQLSDDFPFTRKSWIMERAGWGLLFAILAAALLGGLGPGLFSRRSTASGSLVVEVDRFAHFATEETITLRLTARPGDPDRVSFWIDQAFLDDVRLERIRPLPLEVRPEGDRTTFLFAAPPRHSSVCIRLDVVPERPGNLAGRVGQAKGSVVEVRQFVYP